MRSPLPGAAAGVFCLLAALAPAASAEEGFPSAGPGPEERLTEVRHLLRDEGLASPRAAALAAPLVAGGDLWALRLRVAREALALAGRRIETLAAPDGLDAAPLGLPGLGSWIALTGSGPSVTALLAWGEGEPFEPLARDAVTLAARRARTAAEKSAVREILAKWDARRPRGPRAALDLALARARVAPSPAEARRERIAFAAAHPDAPERWPDLFDPVDLKEFDAAVRIAPEEVRAARARALAPRAPKEAIALLPRTPVSAAARLDTADVRLVTGDYAGALRTLRTPPWPVNDGPLSLRARALDLDASMRLLLRGERVSRTGRRAGRRRPTAPTAPPSSPKPLVGEALTRAGSLLVSAGDLLAQPLAEADLRRLLADAARVSLRAGQGAEARRLVSRLVLLEPGSPVLAEELFREAFEEFRGGRFAEAAASWEEQASLFRDPAVRRRATYWAGRGREKAGQADAARLHFASLLAGSSPDLYASWAAEALRIPLSPPPPPVAAPAGGTGLDGTASGPPSRELLACGLPDLAEDAAEAEGSADPVFLAAVASERDDHRRAAVLLKQRWPELGTPEEGGVPLGIRRLYYPRTHGNLLAEAAAEAGVPPALVFGLVRQESVFTPAIRSQAGAVGLMQVMPATGRQIHRRSGHGGRPDLTDPDVNVRLGVAYLRQMLDLFSGDPFLALAAYNAGPARARRWRTDLGALPPDEFLESLPIAESRLYVKRVLFFEGAYAALYGLPASPSRPSARREAVNP